MVEAWMVPKINNLSGNYAGTKKCMYPIWLYHEFYNLDLCVMWVILPGIMVTLFVQLCPVTPGEIIAIEQL